ncbi:hypothetical protein NEIRO03_0261 [Nematocida sp. AWRm78]|nr:hypothetical protein NEIRO03_0261 [Nematocida sp. AWRm78]
MINIKVVISTLALSLVFYGRVVKAGAIESMVGIPQENILGLCSCLPNAACKRDENIEKLSAIIRETKKAIMRFGSSSAQCLDMDMLMNMGLIPQNTGTECLDALIRTINPFQVLTAETVPASYNTCFEFKKALLSMLNLRLTGGYAAIKEYMALKSPQPNQCGNSSFIGFGNSRGDMGSSCGCGSSDLFGGIGSGVSPMMSSSCSGGMGGGIGSGVSPMMSSSCGCGTGGGMGGGIGSGVSPIMPSSCGCGTGGGMGGGIGSGVSPMMPSTCSSGMPGMGEFSSLGGNCLSSGITDIIAQMKANNTCPENVTNQCKKVNEILNSQRTNVTLGGCCNSDLNAMMLRSLQEQPIPEKKNPTECPLNPASMIGILGAAQCENSFQQKLNECSKPAPPCSQATQVSLGGCCDECEQKGIGQGLNLWNTNLGLTPGLGMNLGACGNTQPKSYPCMNDVAGEMAKLSALHYGCRQ